MNSLTEVRHAQEITFSKLADVPRPTALEQNGLGSAHQPLDLLAISIVAFLEKVLDEQRNIIQTLAQAGNANLNRSEAIEEVLTEGGQELLRANRGSSRQSRAYPHGGLPVNLRAEFPATPMPRQNHGSILFTRVNVR
jgi:hypothetical protein